MVPTIRVDAQVYEWLKGNAQGFGDSPNAVLRRIARLESVDTSDRPESGSDEQQLSGKLLVKRWKVEVKHALYHRDGMFYENLTEFPGALFDPNGYVVFKTKEEYDNCPQLRAGQKLNVAEGILKIPGYRRMT